MRPNAGIDLNGSGGASGIGAGLAAHRQAGAAVARFAGPGAIALLAVIVGGVAAAPGAAAPDGPVRPQLADSAAARSQEGEHRNRSGAEAGMNRPGDYRFTIDHGGRARLYRVHVPAGYDPATPAPLLVVLHGGGGNMDYQATDAYYGQISKSQREGFVAVFPNGYSRFRNGRFATWNAGHCCGGARDRNVDDVGFIRQIVANLTGQLNIDRRRIYATGMSNGALMAYRLACELPEVFTAIAAVAGTDNTRDCAPAKPVSVLHIHARNDTHVLFDGGAGPDVRDPAKVTDFTSVAGTVEKWRRLNGCPAAPRRILSTDGAYCERYAPCRDGAAVQLCVTATGGHSWPGGHKPRGSEPPSRAISANDVMWDFFKSR